LRVENNRLGFEREKKPPPPTPDSTYKKERKVASLNGGAHWKGVFLNRVSLTRSRADQEKKKTKRFPSHEIKTPSPVFGRALIIDPKKKATWQGKEGKKTISEIVPKKGRRPERD